MKELDKYCEGNLSSINIIHAMSGGYISANKNLYKNLINTKLTKLLLKKATLGTPLIKLGWGSPKVILVSGVHGNELPPQAASVNLLNYLNEKDINGTVYLVPFVAPESTMLNIRKFRSIDLNRATMIRNTITNKILTFSKKENIDAIGDFHSTAINANPGKEGVFSTEYPTFESFNIASFISGETSSNHFKYKRAGIFFAGALEDEANLNNIPAVTSEVISKNGYIDKDSLKRSFAQMLCFLRYFDII